MPEIEQQQKEEMKMFESTKITEYSKTASALAELSEKFKGVVFDVTTSAGMKTAKEARAEIKGYRVDLERMRKDLKADILERGRLIDGEAKRITAALEELENPIDAQIKTEEERKERERLAKIKAEEDAAAEIRRKLSEIDSMPAKFVGRSSKEIRAAIASEIPLIDVGFDPRAEQARANAILKLGELADKAEAQEAEQARIIAERAELEKLRAEAEARRAEDERRAAEARAEEEKRLKAIREVQEAELRAQREAERIKRESERAEHEARMKAEREAQQALLARQREEQAKAEADAKAKREAEEAKQREAARAESERVLRCNLDEIAGNGAPIYEQLMQAYILGRADMAAELGFN